MPYEYLKQVGADDRGEQGKESRHRRKFLADVEGFIQANLAAIKAFKAEAANGPRVATGIPPYGTKVGADGKPHRGPRVEALVNFHMQQQDNVTKLDRLNAQTIWYRQWIFRQGAHLTPDGKVIWPRSFRTVEYDSQLAKRDVSRLQFRGDGMLYLPNGKRFDTKQLVTAHSGPGYAIYVMSAEGHIYAGNHAVGYRHHSSFLAGGEVAGAGEMQVHDGVLRWISNNSGHYQPDLFMLYQVINELYKSRVPMSFRVCALTAAGAIEYPSPDAFLKGNLADDVTWRYTKLCEKYGATTLTMFLYSADLVWCAAERSFKILSSWVPADFDAVVAWVEKFKVQPQCWENFNELRYDAPAAAKV